MSNNNDESNTLLNNSNSNSNTHNTTDSKHPHHQYEDDPTFDIEHGVEMAGFGRYQMFMLVCCSLCWLVGAIAFESVTWIVDAFKEGSEEDLHKGLIVIATPIGILAFSGVVGAFSDVYGRSVVIVTSLICSAIAFMANVFAEDWQTAFIFRVLTGCSVAGLEMAPNNLFLETTPENWRGRLRPLMHTSWHIGSFLCIIFASVINQGDWQTFNLLCTIPVIFTAVVTFPWFLRNESPYFFNFVGRNAEAKESLNKIAEYNGLPKLEGEVRGYKMGNDLPWTDRMKILFSTPLIIPNIMMAMMFMFLSSAYFLTLVFLADCIRDTDQAHEVHEVYTAGPSGRLLGSILSSLLIDRVGLLNMIILGGFLGCLSGISLLLSTEFLTMWVSLFFMYMCIEIIFCSLYTYAPVLYPSIIRGTAVGILVTIGDVADVVFGFLGHVASDKHPVAPIITAVGMLMGIAMAGSVLKVFDRRVRGHRLPENIRDVQRNHPTLPATPSHPHSPGSNRSSAD